EEGEADLRREVRFRGAAAAVGAGAGAAFLHIGARRGGGGGGRKHGRCDRKGVVLPYPPRQRGEIEVRVPRPRHALDVHGNIVVIDDGDFGRLDAVPGQPAEPHRPLERPDRNGGVDPVLVAPLPREAREDVPQAAYENEDGEEHVPGEEEFVGALAQG
ncbi:MAG: hypothetical protein Q9193_002078, partial [Seirophora villosa]